MPIDELLGRLADVGDLMARSDHPGFFAFIPGQSTWPGALADFYASALDLHATDWAEAPGPSQIELTVIDWVRDWVGYPTQAGGVFGSGGSAANMTALACAREVRVGAMRGDLVVYLTDQAHSSLARAARILGFRPEQVRVLPVDDRFRMRPEVLATMMDRDIEAGRMPLFVAGAAGSTNTGAIDPLSEIAAVVHERGAWFHVDAAYGGGVLLSARHRSLISGVHLADSITLDAHKWMYQPYECGMLLVRDLADLHRAFEITPEYLADVESLLREPNFSDLGMQLTRSARALKMWFSTSYFGVDAFERAVDDAMEIAEHAQHRIEASDSLELLAPPSLGVLCFRRTHPSASEDVLEQINAHLVETVAASGGAFISSTRLRGTYALRMVVLNHSTQKRDVDALLDQLERAPIEPTTGARVRRDISAREGRALDGFVRGGTVASEDLAAVPLFADLSQEELAAVARVGYERLAAAGEHLLSQWDTSRELIVILDGDASVESEGKQLRVIGPGDFIGEIAALEWHEGFTYPRTATVVATAPMRLFVIPGGLTPRLASDFPSIGDTLRRAVRERLPNL